MKLHPLLSIKIVFFALCAGFITSTEGQEAPVQFISLGSSCDIALNLRKLDLRTEAYPFDWLLTLRHDPFITLLKEDFLHFLDQRDLVQHPKRPYKIENTYYELEFTHDQLSKESLENPKKFQTELNAIQSKYLRRIHRFRGLNSYPGWVIFFRTAYDYTNHPEPYWKKEGIEKITKAQACELKEALDRYFPQLRFSLVIINFLDEFPLPITGIEGVFEYKIRKTYKTLDYLYLLHHLQKTLLPIPVPSPHYSLQ